MIVKAAAFLVSMLIPILVVQNDGFTCSRNVTAVYDVVHEATGKANTLFNSDEFVRDVLISVSSFGVDVLYVAMALSAVSRLDALSAKLARVVACTYVLRWALQCVFYLPTPVGFVWRQPDFGFAVPSLTVHYANIQDFFYSGHVAICVVSALYFRARGSKWLSFLAATQILYQGAIVLVTRCHYSIDVVAGAMFAHYFWMVV